MPGRSKSDSAACRRVHVTLGQTGPHLEYEESAPPLTHKHQQDAHPQHRRIEVPPARHVGRERPQGEGCCCGCKQRLADPVPLGPQLLRAARGARGFRNQLGAGSAAVLDAGVRPCVPARTLTDSAAATAELPRTRVSSKPRSGSGCAAGRCIRCASWVKMPCTYCAARQAASTAQPRLSRRACGRARCRGRSAAGQLQHTVPLKAASHLDAPLRSDPEAQRSQLVAPGCAISRAAGVRGGCGSGGRRGSAGRHRNPLFRSASWLQPRRWL